MRRLNQLVIGATLAALLGAGCGESKVAAPAPAPTEAPTKVEAVSAAPPSAVEPKAQATALTLVDPSQVCMVNNQFMGKPQIPVEVSGKTYYGCCEMCKGKLLNDAAARTAIDPASKREVDKASAVIAKNEAGDVLYFENEANLATYLRSTGS
jgi:YHS domain-containing protein